MQIFGIFGKSSEVRNSEIEIPTTRIYPQLTAGTIIPHCVFGELSPKDRPSMAIFAMNC